MTRVRGRNTSLNGMSGGLSALIVLAAAVILFAVPARAAAHNDYSGPSTWLCRPGRADSCAAVLSATVIAADGSQSTRNYKPDPNAPIDCFYVYPTVSREQQPNSDMVAGRNKSVPSQPNSRDLPENVAPSLRFIVK